MAPSPLDSPLRIAGGTSALPRVPQSNQCPAGPRAGSPPGGRGAQTGKGPCPRAAALNLLPSGRRRPQTGLGVLAADSSISAPKSGKILQGSQTLKGLPTPWRFPEPAGSPSLTVSPPSLPVQCTPWTLTLQGPSSSTTLRDAPPTKFLRAPQGPQTLLGPLECPNSTGSPMEPQISQSLPPSDPSGHCWGPQTLLGTPTPQSP